MNKDGGSKPQLKTEIISTTVGMSSLIGVGPERPCGWGNYCSVQYEGTDIWGLRIWNMWAENIRAADAKFNLDGEMVAEVLYRDDKPIGAVVTDKRIPDDWKYNKLCFTGGPGITAEEATLLYGVVGDPGNELEQFTDPKSYHEKRGWTWSESGIISKQIKAQARTLSADWKIVQGEEYIQD